MDRLPTKLPFSKKRLRARVIYRRLCHYYVRAALPDMRPPTASSILATDLKTDGEITTAPAL
ncbi:hypothetical protein Plec18167_005087 [Paecilomyces lecythidis]|uniref:Uncharacterized protein n=1 Tax=Paecilomyces lecythidis TaxID=3004212 RepID=A0ABR3XM53_9EURO